MLSYQTNLSWLPLLVFVTVMSMALLALRMGLAVFNLRRFRLRQAGVRFLRS